MEKINMWMTKRNVLLLSFVGVVSYFGLDLLYRHALISSAIYKFIAEPLAHLSISLLLVSFVLFMFRDELFKLWLRFAYWWVPFHIFVVTLVIIRDRSNMGGFFNVSLGDSVSVLLSCLFFAISLVLIVVGYFILRKKS